MMKSSRLLLAASAVMLSACGNTGYDKSVDSVSSLHASLQKVRTASDQSDLSFEIVESLTTEVGPRIPGSQGDKRAVEWAETKLIELGFDRVYKQPVKVRNWERGFANASVTLPFSQRLVITALGGSIATPPGGIQAQVLMFANIEALRKAAPEKVKDKIVFLNTRMQRDKAGKFYGKVVPNRVSGAVEAAKLGASAVVIRSVGTANSRFAHTGVMRYSDEVEKIPAGAISNADADVLEAIFSRDRYVELSLEMQAKDTGWQTSYNVIGEITGKTHPQDIVLVGAHLDSWDEGTGALDDGAGIGIVTAAATLVRDTLGQPERTIRVVYYAAEEIGLVGANQYVRNNKDSLKDIVIAAESDFGAGRIYQIDTRFSEQALDKSRLLMESLKDIGIEQGSNDSRGGPDISMLPNYCVPVLSLRQDGTYYFDYHHTPDDTLDKVDLDAIRQNQTAWAMMTAFFAFGDVDSRTQGDCKAG